MQLPLRRPQPVLRLNAPKKLVSFNTLISSHSTSPVLASPSLLFRRILLEDLSPNASTFTSLTRASASIRNDLTAASVHSRVVGSGFSANVCVQTSLLGMYSNCGLLESANQIFDEMVERDSVAWNSIIFSYTRSRKSEKGLQLLGSMILEGLVPNRCTFSIALSACGRVGDWARGWIIHSRVIKSELSVDNPLENSLVDMYASCGDLAMAMEVFHRIEVADLVSWNSLISGFSDAGEGEAAMDAFVRLKALSFHRGLKPED